MLKRGIVRAAASWRGVMTHEMTTMHVSINAQRKGTQLHGPSISLLSEALPRLDSTHVDISKLAVVYTALSVNPMIVPMTSALSVDHASRNSSGSSAR